MNWLNPSLLPLLAAAGIPLLLYLMSRRRLPKIMFSTIRFLKLLEKKQHRRVKVTQWLLILLRILAVLCIVAAFARPLTVGALPVGSPATAEIAIVLDRSASMAARTPAGTPFDQSVRTIRALVNALSPQDKVSLLFADELDTAKALTSAVAIRSALDGESPKPLRDNLASAITRAEHQLQNSSAPFRAIALFTDGVGENDSLIAPPAPKLKYFRWTPPEISSENLAITDIQQREPLIDESSGVLVSASVHSYSDAEKTTTVKLSLGSLNAQLESVGELTIELAPHAEKEIEWVVKPQGSGPWTLRAELLSEDLLAGDNKRDLILPAARKSTVTLSGDPGAEKILNATLNALQVTVDTRTGNDGKLTIHAGKRPPAQSAQQWKARWDAGESLWLMPSLDADIAEWNQWLTEAELPVLQSYQTTLRGRYPLKKESLTGILRSWVKAPDMTVSGRWLVASDVKAPLVFEDGSPAWIDRKHGHGAVRLETVPATGAGWETEPLRIPLFARGLTMLQGVDALPASECGANVEIPDEYRSSLRWTSPSGTTTIADHNRINLLETGFWRDDSNHAWSALFPATESTRAKRTRFGNIADTSFTVLPNAPEAAVAAWKHTRNGREWRTILLGAALLLLVTENVIGRGVNRT